MKRLQRERLGAPDCPLMDRWTLHSSERCKVVVHHFLPMATDPDTHDHPRAFVTFVLWGSYLDVREDGSTELVRAPTIRRRPAEHAHRTLIGERGAWTVVVMGQHARPWGFWRDKVWYGYREYERIFGFAFRCEESPEDRALRGGTR